MHLRSLALPGITLALVMVATAGTSGRITQHVSDTFAAMMQELPFTAQQPIAREARFTYYSRIFLGDKPQPVTFATNEPGSAASPTILPVLIPPAGSTTPMSTVFERKRDEARADGNRMMESLYARMSRSALMNEIASGRLNAQLGLVMASLNALSAAGAAMRQATGERLQKWTTTATASIGPSAPAGSTLHLGFFMFTHASGRFAIESRIELIVTAALETPATSDITRSARAIELFTYRDGNPAAAAPATGFLVHNEGLFEGKTNEVKSLNSTPMGRQLAVLANSAVADLYARIEEAKQPPD